MTNRAQPSNLGIAMPIWNVEPVADQPDLSLVSWQVMQVPDGGRHFVGYCPENREGRASSVIELMDLERLQGITSSGRVYQLKGKPGWNPDAEHTWRRWCAINSVTAYEDVTAEVWKAHLATKDEACSS